MKRYACRSCGFESLRDPGERCPGCGYLFAYLNRQPPWTRETLKAEEEEIPIRRLDCALVRQDQQKDAVMLTCTITNRGMRLRQKGESRGERLIQTIRKGQETPDILLPYRRIARITPGTHMGKPARFFTYHHDMLGAMNLWFFADRGVAAQQADIDYQVMELVREMKGEQAPPP